MAWILKQCDANRKVVFINAVVLHLQHNSRVSWSGTILYELTQKAYMCILNNISLHNSSLTAILSVLWCELLSFMLSTLSQQVEVRWDGCCWRCLWTWGGEKMCHMTGYVLGPAGLYSSAHLHWDGHQFSDANLFLHCANLPPSSILHCSRHWVSNPCKKKDCQENEI